MEYRREIDGLRAIAVLPVMLYHAGLHAFSGGFVGVDIFFVISGYLITSIVLAELQGSRFTLLKFYERRARRILPALFLVMGVSSIISPALLLPDELKNFGQSLVAATLSSNNCLLAITSGYWNLASEFKPLLHTWSLGVEEQYYIIFPLLLILGWRFFRPRIGAILIAAGLISFSAACYGVVWKPDLAFFLLPTRAWEIIVGCLTALYLGKLRGYIRAARARQAFGALGITLILASFLFFDRNNPSPGLSMLMPVLGAALVIIFATEETMAGRLLGSRVLVALGLISYSAYLWHQPLFSFARVYSLDAPGVHIMLLLALLSIALAYLTYRFVEVPFRKREGLGRVSIWYSACICSALFISFGFYLHKSYGLAHRMFDMNVVSVADIDKAIYNQRVFTMKKDEFARDGGIKILVVGNSFARDFVNMTTETFDLSNAEIVYRDDFDESISLPRSDVASLLYGSADIIVFASGGYQTAYISENIEYAENAGKHVYYIGTKHFGYNLNWLVRIPFELRPNQFNPLLAEVMDAENLLVGLVPSENYISLLSPIVRDGRVPITDSKGQLISVDRTHLTKFGAIYLGEKSLSSSRFGTLLKKVSRETYSGSSQARIPDPE